MDIGYCHFCGNKLSINCCDVMRDLSRKSETAGSVPPLPLGDALATFEGALNDLHCVLFRDGVEESFNDLLCKVDDELLQFKEHNKLNEPRGNQA